MEPERFTGLAARQTTTYLAEHVDPALTPYVHGLGSEVDIRV
jgi:hypothetical protein